MKQYGPITAFTRREFLSTAAAVPLLAALSARTVNAASTARQPSYRSLQPFIEPGRDEFTREAEAVTQRSALHTALRSRRLPLASDVKGRPPQPAAYRTVGRDVREAVFGSGDVQTGWAHWIEGLGEIRRCEFYILPNSIVRFEVASSREGELQYRVGRWRVEWKASLITAFEPLEESVASAQAPWFADVTAHCLGELPAFQQQLRFGVPYWRSRLDPACGIDLYGSNGIAAGDIDGDGVDEIYVCQGGGLPNRLLKFRPDGTLEDITNQWGADLLDDTSCALFLDLRNTGRQDLVVLRSGGPVLFLNDGERYRMRDDAFEFATPPQGGFTGMAAADFDRDGKLDLYLCCYVYFQSEAQYTYASPYHDAQNGPPNFLFRNRVQADGTGAFIDCTAETGMNENNNRFSFAPAWCDYNGDGWPDLYVANDFGRKNLYRNRAGHFHDVAAAAGVEDIGPGMSAAWFDYDGDGRPDLYVANMWTDAGQRTVADEHFAPAQAEPEAYRAHTMGNSLYRNRGDGGFENTTERLHAGFGRWAWSSGGHDLDNDGHPEIMVTCGMLTNKSNVDLNGFFWRQVVARSPMKPGPSAAYENGWNAINQFAREEYSWSGHEPNVLHARRGERFFDVSGISGFDWAEDSRAFAVTDFDGDGRPDIILKSRLGPQVRVLQNRCASSHRSIGLRLRGTKSNWDAIGARVSVSAQTKWLEAGSGFLSQASKQLLFGLGEAVNARVHVLWPSGTEQDFGVLQAGATYTLVEGSVEVKHVPFRAPRPFWAVPASGVNDLVLTDTWFREPVPLPKRQSGPGLFVIRAVTPEYEIFRRYLFDWRAPLVPPLALLLNGAGEAVKVYAAVPSDAQVKLDLASLESKQAAALPFSGFYVGHPKRDFFKFGAAYLWAGFPAMALPYLQRVLQGSPGNARVWVLVGQIYLDTDQVDAADDAFTHALRLEPASVNAVLGLGDVARRRDQTQQATERYRQALALDPQSADAANALGLLLAKQGDAKAAQSYFEQAIRSRRNYAEAINNLAVLFSEQSKTDDAIAAWTYGIRVAPDEDILYLNLGRTYVRMGAPEKARVTMQQLLDRKPDNVTARRALQELEGR